MRSTAAALLALATACASCWTFAGPPAIATERHDVARLLEGPLASDAELLPTNSSEADQRRRVARALAALLVEFAEPPLLEDESITAAESDQLEVRARPAGQAWVRDALGALHRSGPGFPFLQTRLFRVPSADYANLDVGDEPKILADESEATRFFDMVDKAQDVRSIPVQDVPLSVHDIAVGMLLRRWYVKAYREQQAVLPDLRTLVVPELEPLDEGTSFHPRALRLGSGRFALKINLEHAELKRPIETRSTEHGEVCVPQWRRASIESALVVDSEKWVVFPSPDCEGVHFVLAVVVRPPR